MNEWMSLLEAAEFLGLHFHTVRRLARRGSLVERQVPWKGSATRYVVEYSRASVEAHRAWLDRQPPPPDPAEWMPIEEAQKALKMTRHGVKRRIRLGLLNAMHQGVHAPGSVTLYVSRKQVEEQGLERPAYARRTHWEEAPADEMEYAWLAGFFDGEGCVQIAKNKPSQRVWVLYIVIVNTYEPIIQHLIETFGGTTWKKVRHNSTWKDVYAWRINGDEAQAVLRRMRPYLRVKHLQADIGIEFQERMRSRRYGRWDTIPAEEIEWRDAAQLRMAALNRRGAPLIEEE